MSAAYDTFDYPSYWIGRDYEHKSEIIAIKAFLSRIKKIHTILEIGAGFGRLAPVYSFRAKKVILTDPSARTLKIARTSLPGKKTKFFQSSLETLPKKIRASSVDLIIMVRVIHHITNPDKAFKIINRTLRPGGYLIFEFANKRHIKATLRNIFRGNFKFIRDEETTDLRSIKAIKKRALPFLNYHPEKIKAFLDNYGFEVVDNRSVSNIRSTFFKRTFATELLISLEKLLQKPFSYLDLGPSIFILARKH